MNLGKYLGKFSFVRFEIGMYKVLCEQREEGAALNGHFDK